MKFLYYLHYFFLLIFKKFVGTSTLATDNIYRPAFRETHILGAFRRVVDDHHFRDPNSDVLRILGNASEMTSSDDVPTNISVGMETCFL